MVQGKCALHMACHKGQMAIVHMLLDAGVQVDLGDDDGDAPLTFTAYGYCKLFLVLNHSLRS